MNERIAKYTAEISEVIAVDGQRVGYVYAIGIIRALADPGTGSGMSDTDRLAGIRDALAALDQAKAQPRGWTTTPAGYEVPADLDDDPRLWTGETR